MLPPFSAPPGTRLGVVYRDRPEYRLKNRPGRAVLGREQLQRISQTVVDVERLIHDHRFGASMVLPP
ncbi:hypothetical protein ACIBEJ_25280 [Nonomuraea sp. NPDC050790]|uniref:hypothetical protein n=1 Tax=Nonomuraea sp. NPDC050790 TaxID=3364371 RepID=UPI00378D3F2E